MLVLGSKTRVACPYPHGANKIIDFVKYHSISSFPSNTSGTVDYSLETKHYTPHQQSSLQAYLRYSLGECITDVIKQAQCGFSKFYILQIQTEVTNFNINKGKDYADFLREFPFFKKVFKGMNEQAVKQNIYNIKGQNRLNKLEKYSRDRLDNNLLIGNLPNTVTGISGNVDVVIHYLVSGDFNNTTVLNKIDRDPNPLIKNFNLKEQIKPQIGLSKNGKTPTWEIDISI